MRSWCIGYQEHAMQLAFDINAMYTSGDRSLLELSGGHLPASNEKLKIDNLSSQISGPQITKNVLVLRLHRPYQPHRRNFFVGAFHRSLPGSIDNSLGVSDELGLCTPAFLDRK